MLLGFGSTKMTKISFYPWEGLNSGLGEREINKYSPDIWPKFLNILCKSY